MDASALRVATTQWDERATQLRELEIAESLLSDTTSNIETLTLALAKAEQDIETLTLALANAEADTPSIVKESDDYLNRLITTLTQDDYSSTTPYLCISYILLSSITVFVHRSVKLLHALSGIHFKRHWM